MIKPLLAIVGPTAIGKSGLALELAQKFDGEVVNADSRQVYRFMEIGTAKPSSDERSIVPHHLYDIVDPDEDFSLALYQDMAYKAIESIHEQSKLPLLVGGSGQYVWSILEGWSIPEVPPDYQLREELESRAENEGGDTLFRELQSMDPKAANQIDPKNLRRVIRALEVCLLTGKRFSDLRKKTPPDVDVQIIGLTADRDELYRRIDNRVDWMMNNGFIEEVQALLDRGYSQDLPSMSSLGYREIAEYLKGKMGLTEACQQIKYTTHNFARHQYSWFRLGDERIQWFDIGSDQSEILAQIEANLR